MPVGGRSRGRGGEVGREQVREWAASQFRRRADSVEAQQLAAMASSAGWPPERVLFEFLRTQWAVVCHEGQQRFRGAPAADGLPTDAEAMKRGLRRVAPVLFPASHEQPLANVIEALDEAHP